MTDAIKVAVRVRPLSKQERESGHSFAWNVQANCISPVDSRDSRYALDHVFGPNWTTHRIYEATTQPLLHKVISGFNSTVFAYGQTSSGKTYTMRGTPEDAGLIPLAVNEIFALIESCQDREFLLRVSYMELYNEEVHDLLAPKQMKLPIHESRENGVYVCGLREDIVTCPEQVLQLLEEGEANRHVGSTKMNDTSSRSHTVFRMVVESRALEADMNDAGAVLVSTLTLVDLAGSERVAKTGAEGIRMKEGTAINKSLLTLGNVINKLSEGAQAQGAHIPYRDSKLTRILQPSLGGNAKTSVICAITPALCHAEESHSTLRFACRAKRVVNNAVVNEVLSDAAVLKRQAHEIEELKNRLSASGMTAEVEEQISHLRAQHLRSEQEKDLYRIKLEEEKLEREKAQKQVEVARKMMFESGGSREDVPKKSNRRETWCPGGKAGWKAPASAVEAFQAVSQDDSSNAGGGTGARKRSFNGDAGTTGGQEAGSSQQHQRHPSNGSIAEGEEEEDGAEAGVETVGEGPTPQRRRRAGRSMGSTSSDASDLRDGGAVVNELERIADGLDGQDRATLEAAVSQLGGMRAQVAAMQRELDDVARLATTKDDELRYAESEMEAAVEERDRLAPQVEEAKWHARQLEKRIEEAQAASQATGKERDVLAEQLSALQESSAAELQEAATKLAALEAERAGFKDQIKALNSSLSDVKDALTCEAEQKKLVEARAHASREELAEAEAQLRQRGAELDAQRKAQESAHERMEAAEARSRDLYEANKRLEAHVHDLESRKRAPLYQKKQEEELRAANEKAMEADVRAAEAEMNAKEFKANADALQGQLAELQAAAEKAARLAAEAAAETATKHNFEVQRLCNERAKIQDAHMEELEQLNFLLESTKETLEGVQAKAAAQAKQVEELTAQLADMHKQMGERDAVQAELQACAAAASEKIAHLEEEAEAMQTANEQAVEGLKKELQAAQEAATQVEASLRRQLQEERASAAEQLRITQEQAGEQVRSAQAQAQEAQAAAATATTDATKRIDEMKSQVATMEARLQEAAGALKAKDDLREERMKHKQEVSSLKSDIQKLQLESKNGGRSKELAAKEMEALKKKVGDLENKMRVAIQDKNSACQEKSKLESQVKQLVSQKQLLDRNQGKQENIELKKRESIMVNFNKNRETLNSTEEKLKAATVELQKTGMDLVAKRSECQSLEGQVAEQESKISQMQAENAKLGADLAASNEAKDSLQAEHSSVQERLAATSTELGALQTAHEQTSGALASLREEHTALTAAKEQLGAEAEQLRAALQDLTTSSNEMAEQMGTLHAEHAELRRQYSAAQEELAGARASVSAAEDARIAAESRLPELQELQQQLSAAHEEVADLQYAANEQQAAATQQEQAAADRQAAADKAAQELQSKLQQLEANLASTRARRNELQQQLDQAVELYTVVQGHADTLGAEKARLEEQLVERTRAQDASHARVACLEGEMEGLKAELGAVRAELSQAEAQAASHAEGLAKAQADLEAVCAGREAAQQEAAAAARAEAQADVDVARKEAAAAKAGVQADVEAACAGNREAAQQEAAAALAGAQAELQAACAGREAAQQEAAAAKARAEAAAAAAEEAAGLKSQLAQAMQEFTDLEFSWNEERAALEVQAQQLKGELAAAQAAAAEAQQLKEELAQVQQLKGELAAAQAAIGEVQQLRGELVAAQAAATEAQQLKEELAQAQQLRGELAAAQAAVAAAADDTAAFKAGAAAQPGAAYKRGSQGAAATDGRDGSAAAATAAAAPAEASEQQQQQQQQQLEGYAAQVAALQERLQGMEGAASRAAQLERELQARQGEHEALAQERCQLLQRLEELSTAAAAASQQEQPLAPRTCSSAFGSPVAAATPAVDAAAPAADLGACSTEADAQGQALAAALAARAALEQHNQQLASHRDQLLHVIDDLSVQLAASRASAAGGSCGQNNAPAENGADEAEGQAGMVEVKGEGQMAPEEQQQQQQQQPTQDGQGGAGHDGGQMMMEAGDGARVGGHADVAGLQQVLAEAQAELASKEAQLQEACQAYNDLTSEVAEKDLQLQQLQAAPPVTTGEGAVHASLAVHASEQTEAATQHQQQQQQQQQQMAEELQRKLAEADGALAALHARCTALEGEAATQQQQQRMAEELQHKLAEANTALAALHARCAALEEDLRSSKAAADAAAAAAAAAADGGAAATEAPGAVQSPAGEGIPAVGMFAAPTTSVVPKGEEVCERGGVEARDVQMAETGEGGQGLADTQAQQQQQQQQQVEDLQQRVCVLQQDLAGLQASKNALQQDAEQRVQHLQHQLAMQEQRQQQLATAVPATVGAGAAERTEKACIGADTEQPAALAAAGAGAEVAGVEKTSVAELEDGVETHRHKQQELEAYIEQLKVALESALAARATAESHLQQSLNEAAAARAALESAQQQQQQQDPSQDDEQRQQLEDKVAQLQIALDNAAAAKAAVEARLGGEAAEAKMAATGLGQELDAVRSKVEQLEADLLDSETLSEQLRSAIDAKTTATHQATAQAREALASLAALSEQQDVLQAELATVQQQAGDATAEVQRLKEAWQVEASRRKEAQSAGEALQASLDDMHTQMGLLVVRAQEAEAARTALAEHLQAVQQQQQQPQGPTPAQQEMLARMAQRLEALEAGHRRAIERLHEERDEARAAVEALQAQVEAERQQAAVAVEEVDLCAKAKEAELNARMLSLESQIHWLGEQNTQLQAELVRASSAGGDKENSGSGAAAYDEQIAELSHKCAALEADLRRTKRAEMKLQALLFRMRSDIETAGGSCASFDNLRDVRSLEYDVDMLTQKLKRTERLLQQQQQQGNAGGRGTPSKQSSKAAGPLAEKAANPLADKENMVQQRGLIGGHSDLNSRW